MAMHHSMIAIAVVGSVSASSALALPPLLDSPGPGYREQLKLLTPELTPKVHPPVIWFRSPSIPESTPLDKLRVLPLLDMPDGSRPFSEPIRLFDASNPNSPKESSKP